MELKTVQANKVKSIQYDLNFTNEKMAESLGITAEVYTQKLSGFKNWTLHDVQVLQALSGKSFDYLMGIIC